MSVQVRKDNVNVPFILYSGPALTEMSAVLLQDAGRGTAELVYGTLMAKVAASQKWVPFSDETAVDGSAIPLGIFVGTNVTGAALVAGDVVDAPILVGGLALIDVNQLVIENSKTLATVVPASDATNVYFTQTVKDYLANVGIFTEATIATSGFENA